ncbi:MAG: formylglycine-generating enzyme family protein, partial [Kiritimatiellae bacterium]|nr:formylglycine-generating enzyme family protein [Kiritimatiellia bacterium]
EAEWEYACRAGTGGAYGGTGNLDEMGWYYGNSGNQTHPVKHKKPNDWGLYDMIGNVWEWCADRYGEYPSGSVTDPTGPSEGVTRVNRGGSWSDYVRNCRSARRGWNEPGYRVINLGFRPVLAPSHRTD